MHNQPTQRSSASTSSREPALNVTNLSGTSELAEGASGDTYPERFLVIEGWQDAAITIETDDNRVGLSAHVERKLRPGYVPVLVEIPLASSKEGVLTVLRTLVEKLDKDWLEDIWRFESMPWTRNTTHSYLGFNRGDGWEPTEKARP